jgi:hypothetical protein
MEALGEQVSEERLKALVNASLAEILEGDSEFGRKMRFGRSPERLVGTKYARWGLSPADVEFAYDLLTAAQRIGKSRRGPSVELEKTFRAISQAYYMEQPDVRDMDERALDEYFRFHVSPAWLSAADRALYDRGAWAETEAYQVAYRAMDTAESGYGSQLIGAQYVAELWEAARKESRIFALLDSFEMGAPTAYIPVEADIPEMLYVSESTSASASDYTTSKTGSNRATVTAKKMIIHQMWSGEMEEDSILPFIPYIRRQAQLSVAHYADSAIYNGDATNAGTGNINLDDADPADTKHYLAFDGIRHAWLVDNSNNETNHAGAALTYNALVRLRKLMIDTTYLQHWGHPTSPEDVVYVAEPDTSDEIALLDETLTVDKYAAGAMVVAGEITRIGRHPLISSMAASKTEADGKVSTTAANNTLGQVSTFNRRAFKVGWRRRVKVEVERLPATDQTRLVHSLRIGLGRYSPTGAASGIEAAAGLRNIAL